MKSTFETGAATKLHFGDMVYDRDVFNVIVAAGTNGAIVNLEAANKLAELELIEVNPNSIHNGNIAARVLPYGSEAHSWNQSEEGQASAKKVRKARVASSVKTPTTFTISEDDIPIPPARRGGGRGVGENYPFGKLFNRKSFHIPTSIQDQAVLTSRINSSVSTANVRYAEQAHPLDGFYGAFFVTRAVGADDRDGVGIRVWRHDEQRPKEEPAQQAAE